MMDSNQALSWMVFQRDRPRFESLHPALVLEKFDSMPGFTCLADGRVTAKYLVPRFMNPAFIAADWLLQPVEPLFSLHCHIRVRKRNKN